MFSHDVRGVADAMTESVQDVATGGGHVVFETDRIRVRPWRTDEADRFLDILSRYDVAKWLCDGEPELMKDRAEAVARIERYENRRTEDPHTGIWAIEVKQTGVPAGTVLLVPLPNSDAGEIEIGWHLHPDSHGFGFASEAARGVLARGFADGLAEIFAVTHTTNGPSQAVCRRLGMSDLGVVEKWYEGESQCFRITRGEWEASRPVG